MKDMTSVATTMMSEEEKAEIEKQMNADVDTHNGASTPSVASPIPVHVTSPDAAPSANGSRPSSPFAKPPSPAKVPLPTSPTAATHSAHTSLISTPPSNTENPSPSPSTSSKEKDAAAAKKRANKLSAEQKAKLHEQEKERRKVMEARIKMLTTKLIDRLRPFVEAEKPGEKDDKETLTFEAKMKREAEDLKLESFGVEVSFLWRISVHHTMRRWFHRSRLALTRHCCSSVAAHYRDSIYDESFLILQIAQIFGNASYSIYPPLHLIIFVTYSPGFFSRLKEKGSLAKDVWGAIGSA